MLCLLFWHSVGPKWIALKVVSPPIPVCPSLPMLQVLWFTSFLSGRRPSPHPLNPIASCLLSTKLLWQLKQYSLTCQLVQPNLMFMEGRQKLALCQPQVHHEKTQTVFQAFGNPAAHFVLLSGPCPNVASCVPTPQSLPRN